jgi:hypothetical protein
MCWRTVPLHVCTRPSILLPGPGVRKSNLCTWLGAGQLQKKKTREGFFSIYKTRAMLLCLSHAFIQLQSVCAPLEFHTPDSRVPTAVYVSTFYKSFFGSPSADLVFGSSRPSADTSESPCVLEVILNLQVPAAAVKESRICFCSSHVNSLWNLKFSSVLLKLAGFQDLKVTWCSIGIRLCRWAGEE